MLLSKAPRLLFQSRLDSKINQIFRVYEKDYDRLKARVNFYNKLQAPFSPPSSHDDLPEERVLKRDYHRFSRLASLKLARPNLAALKDNSAKYGSVYYFDSEEWLHYFPPNLRFSFLYNDVDCLLNFPAIVKSRPIDALNATSVLLQLEKHRHFRFVKDARSFESKKDFLVFRGAVYQPHRLRFFCKHFNNPRCDLGHVGRVDSNMSADSKNLARLEALLGVKDWQNAGLKEGVTNLHALWQRPKLSIDEQLEYKFLLSLEGYDVASNLKWALSSNSLCMLSKPEIETWFMESNLEAGVHYAEISPDYENVLEVMDYYLSHPAAAKAIIANANAYCAQFFDSDFEGALNLLVLRKFFYLSGQIAISPMEMQLFGL